jgi:ArsR family transcriptional regulator, virulence genes transcriptional regulator
MNAASQAPRANRQAYELHAAICSVLTDPKRLRLIDALRAGERSVGDLADEIGCSLPNASQHLAVLRAAGLVSTRRIGRTILYGLAEPDLVEACDVIHRIVDRRLAGGTARTRVAAPSVDGEQRRIVTAPTR